MRGSPSVADGFPSLRANNVENISLWWRHRGYVLWFILPFARMKITYLWDNISFYKFNFNTNNTEYHIASLYQKYNLSAFEKYSGFHLRSKGVQRNLVELKPNWAPEIRRIQVRYQDIIYQPIKWKISTQTITLSIAVYWRTNCIWCWHTWLQLMLGWNESHLRLMVNVVLYGILAINEQLGPSYIVDV